MGNELQWRLQGCYSLANATEFAHFCATILAPTAGDFKLLIEISVHRMRNKCAQLVRVDQKADNSLHDLEVR